MHARIRYDLATFIDSGMRYLTIEKFCSQHGYTPNAVRNKIKRGDWPKGWVWKKAPDGHVLIIVEGYELWVESGHPVSASAAGVE